MYRDEINQVFSKLQQDFDSKINFTLHYVESIAYEGGKCVILFMNNIVINNRCLIIL